MSNSVSRTDRAVHLSIIILGLVVGLWVAGEFVGFYPGMIEHCPGSEFSCPSHNLRNIIPATVAWVIAMVVIAPLTFGYQQVVR